MDWLICKVVNDMDLLICKVVNDMDWLICRVVNDMDWFLSFLPPHPRNSWCDLRLVYIRIIRYLFTVKFYIDHEKMKCC
jgi:hypothetical protein